MKFKRILCPVDFSETSVSVYEYANMVASATGAEVVLLHVLLPDVNIGSLATFDPRRDERRALEQLKHMATGGQEQPGKCEVRMGLAAEQIIRFAEDNDIDLIVLGTHGRTGLKRMLMGSVAEDVIRKAECPVLAIKSGTAATPAT